MPVAARRSANAAGGLTKTSVSARPRGTPWQSGQLARPAAALEPQSRQKSSDGVRLSAGSDSSGSRWTSASRRLPAEWYRCPGSAAVAQATMASSHTGTSGRAARGWYPSAAGSGGRCADGLSGSLPASA